jgi:hypothetical protein
VTSIVFKKAYHLLYFQCAQACRGNESTTGATHGHATIASDSAVQSIGGWPAISDYMVIFVCIEILYFFISFSFIGGQCYN